MVIHRLNTAVRYAQTKAIKQERRASMSKNKKQPLPIDPVDGTRVYKPLDKRFSVGEEFGGVSFANAEQDIQP